MIMGAFLDPVVIDVSKGPFGCRGGGLYILFNLLLLWGLFHWFCCVLDRASNNYSWKFSFRRNLINWVSEFLSLCFIVEGSLWSKMGRTRGFGLRVLLVSFLASPFILFEVLTRSSFLHHFCQCNVSFYLFWSFDSVGA